MSDKIRKYVLPNLPYLFVFWFFSKIGTAYRIAPGTDFGTKLMGMLDTFPKAFETYWPGLGGIDLLVGLAGAAGMYLLIQSKIRQAKKFRRDAEYGTARFGTKEDIKPFVDPKFQNNVILTGTEFLTMNTRPKIPANARNLNACVIGSSGSGKTRFWLTPQLLQAHSSYVVVDPKGGTLDQCGRFLQREKYRVRVFNSIDFSKSMHYNPLAYIKTESDVLKFVTALIANTKGDGKEGDEFWTKAETLLYCALVAYIVFEGPEAINTNRYDVIDQVLSDPRMPETIQGVGFQWEGGQILPKLRAKYPQYKYVQTESECGWGSFDWKAAEHTFGLMNHYLGNGCEEYTFWNAILYDGGFSGWGWKQNALIHVDSKAGTATYTPEYYAVQHYSHYITPGSKILAYKTGKEDKTPVLVVMTPQKKQVAIAGNFNEKAKDITVNLGNRYLNITLQPHSLNTFVEK